MASHTLSTDRTTPEPATPAPGRRSLFGAAAALLATPALAAPAPDPNSLATPADYAAMEFEAIPGIADGLGAYADWEADARKSWATRYLAAATLEKTPDQIAAMWKAEEGAVSALAECINGLREHAEAEARVMECAFVRLLAGAARAGLV